MIEYKQQFKDKKVYLLQLGEDNSQVILAQTRLQMVGMACAVVLCNDGMPDGEFEIYHCGDYIVGDRVEQFLQYAESLSNSV